MVIGKFLSQKSDKDIFVYNNSIIDCIVKEKPNYLKCFFCS